LAQRLRVASSFSRRPALFLSSQVFHSGRESSPELFRLVPTGFLTPRPEACRSFPLCSPRPQISPVPFPVLCLLVPPYPSFALFIPSFLLYRNPRRALLWGLLASLDDGRGVVVVSPAELVVFGGRPDRVLVEAKRGGWIRSWCRVPGGFRVYLTGRRRALLIPRSRATLAERVAAGRVWVEPAQLGQLLRYPKLARLLALAGATMHLQRAAEERYRRATVALARGERRVLPVVTAATVDTPPSSRGGTVLGQRSVLVETRREERRARLRLVHRGYEQRRSVWLPKGTRAAAVTQAEIASVLGSARTVVNRRLRVFPKAQVWVDEGPDPESIESFWHPRPGRLSKEGRLWRRLPCFYFVPQATDSVRVRGTLETE